MSNIVLTVGDSLVADGKQLSFRAPCDCGNVDAISINGVEFSIVDSMGMQLTDEYSFGYDNIVSILLDVTNSRAYILNCSDRIYVDEKILEVTPASIGALPLFGGTMTGILHAQTNTSYTTLQVRDEALYSVEVTPTKNGAICWVYE